jgi:hypothetical protein
MNNQYDMIPDEYSFEIVVAVDRECRIDREDEIVASFNRAYLDIKDPSWPSVTSLADLKNLPQHIQYEIHHVHNGVKWLPYFDLDSSFNLNFGVDIDSNWQDLILDISRSNIKCRQDFYDDRSLTYQQYTGLKETTFSLGHVTIRAKTMTATISISEAQPQLVDIVQNPCLRVVVPKTALPAHDCVLIMVPKIHQGSRTLTLLTEDPGDHWGGPITCMIDHVTADIEIAIDLATGQHRISPV